MKGHILAYGKPCVIADTYGNTCHVVHLSDQKHYSVPFSAISWVCDDWFEKD